MVRSLYFVRPENSSRERPKIRFYAAPLPHLCHTLREKPPSILLGLTGSAHRLFSPFDLVIDRTAQLE